MTDDNAHQLMHQFLTLEGDDLLAFLQTHHEQLLTEAAEQALAELAAATGDESQRQRFEERRQLLQGLRQRQAIAELPPAERLFHLFMSVSNSQEMDQLALRLDEAALDELEQLATQRQAAAAGEEAAGIRQHLDDLRLARQQLRTRFGDRLPLVRRLHGWIHTDSWDESEAYLQAHAAALLTDEAEAALQELLQDNPGNPTLQQHQTLLRESRALGIGPAYANRAARSEEAVLDPAQTQALADKLVAWGQQETPNAAEAYLRQHEAELLSEEAAAVMQLLVQSNPGNPHVRAHQQRLAQAREVGIAAIYTEIRGQWLQEKREALPQMGPLGQAVWQFIQMEDEEKAAALLQSQGDLLLTWDAGNLLRQLAETGPDDDRLQTRYRQWLDARTGTAATPDTTTAQAETERLEAQSGPRYEIGAAMFSAVGDHAATLNVLNFGQVTLRWQRPQMTRHDLTEKAIGRLDELDKLHRQLHGPDDEQTGEVVIVGKGRRKTGRGAVHGMPGVGKSTLAALYAQRVSRQMDEARLARSPLSQLLPLLTAHFTLDELKTVCFQLGVDAEELAGAGKTGLVRELLLYLDRRGRIPELQQVIKEQRPLVAWPDVPPDAPELLYPGGILWLQLNQTHTTPEQVLPELNRLAALAYSDNNQRLQLDLPAGLPPQTIEQIQNRLQGAIFTVEAIQKMLSGHGRILVIADDVWQRQVLPTIRQALPADAHLLVTTREGPVARTAGRTLELDVLSREDALALIHDQFEPMPQATAERLINVVGAHPMALQIALGDLHPDDPAAEWAEAIEKIAFKLAQGLGVDPTTLEYIDPEQRLSVLIGVSYQALAAHGDLQRCFRALGSLVSEASFATEAVAAICQLGETETREQLKILRERNLLRRLDGGRWQQHALLRSFALEQQNQAERFTWAEQHAAYFLEAMRAADDSQTYYTLAGDLPNLRHAFAWAVGEGQALGLAQGLLGHCANLLESQNLGREYLAWAEQVQALAEKIGGDKEKGQAIGSLGNALQNAATLLYGPDRATRLREALAAYDEALELRRDVPLAYATTQNNRANVLSDLATLPGQDRPARLKQALAAYDEALELRRDVPLDYAQTQNNRALLLGDLATLPGQDRAARLKEALAAYDEALELRRDVPLDYAQTQNNRALLLRDLATLPGQDRPALLKHVFGKVKVYHLAVQNVTTCG